VYYYDGEGGVLGASCGGVDGARSDINCDGDVDLSDFNMWKMDYLNSTDPTETPVATVTPVGCGENGCGFCGSVCGPVDPKKTCPDMPIPSDVTCECVNDECVEVPVPSADRVCVWCGAMCLAADEKPQNCLTVMPPVKAFCVEDKDDEGECVVQYGLECKEPEIDCPNLECKVRPVCGQGYSEDEGGFYEYCVYENEVDGVSCGIDRKCVRGDCMKILGGGNVD